MASFVRTERLSRWTDTVEIELDAAFA